MPLTTPDIVARALALLDEAGFPSLTMRRLANSLGVQPSALYWHVPNKQTLLAALAERMLSDRPADASRSPAAAAGAEGQLEDQIVGWALGLRAALTQYRDGAEVVASVLAMRLPDVDPVSELRELLVAAGVEEHRADVGAHTLVSFVVGHCIDEQGHGEMVAFDVAHRVDTEAAGDRFAAGSSLVVAAILAHRPETSAGC